MSDEWHFLIALNEQLRPLQDPVEIQDVAVRLIGEHLQANRVYYAELQDHEFIVRRSYARSVRSSAGQVARLGTATIDACRRGQTVVVADVHKDPRFTDAERAEFLASGIAAFVAVPVTKAGGRVATLGVDSTTSRTWTADQLVLIELAADRTWSADERARAEASLGRITDRQAFLRTLNDTIRHLADPARILQETCRLVGTHLHVNRVTYGAIEGDDCIITEDYVDGLPSLAGRFRWTDFGGSRTSEIQNGGTLFVNDTSGEPHSAAERETLQAAGIRAYICPLLVKDGRFVGSFGVHSREPRVWTPEEIALVEDVAERIWATLEHRRAEAELRANEERLEFLLRLNDALRPLSDPGDVQETAARLVAQHLGVTRVGYAELDVQGQYTIHREYARGAPPLVGQRPDVDPGDRLREAFQRGETVAVNDVQTDPRLSDAERAPMQRRQIAAFIGTTLFKGGRMVAAFGANHVTPRAWTASEVELVQAVAERTWDAVERTRAEAARREQQQRLRVALEASAGGSWTWTAATGQVDWDDRFRSLYGFAPDEPPSRDAWLQRLHEADRPRLLAVFDQVWTSRTKESFDETYRIVRPDGTWPGSRAGVAPTATPRAT